MCAQFVEPVQQNRRDWNVNWNAALEAGGVLVSDEVRIACEVQLMKHADVFLG